MRVSEKSVLAPKRCASRDVSGCLTHGEVWLAVVKRAKIFLSL